MNSLSNKGLNFAMSYKDKLVTFKLANHLQKIVPDHYHSYIIACIGTDRSTGDSLGPLTGSLLQRYRLNHLNVYGTLHKPLHALNLDSFLVEINTDYHNPFIIAIDASLGKYNSIGNLHCNIGPIKPGTALKKSLPEIGHAHISATVNVNSDLNYLILQNTRLSIVYDMAIIIANTLYRLDLSMSEKNRKPSAT